MLLWIAMAVLTAAASLAILAPLGRARASAESAARPDRAIYRDQLAELGRDRERGLIGDAEAEAARIEIARRLLKTDNTDAVAGSGSGVRRIAAVAAVIAVPLIAIGTYLAVGSPNLPDQPLSERRQASNDTELDGLVARVEAHLAQSPEDGKGWEVIGPVYMRMGRFDDAARAFDNTRRILGVTPERDALFGEALTRANGGLVTAEAQKAFERAVHGEPDNVRARFYLAVALGQSGRKDEAIAAWKALIAGGPADAPWLPVAQAELARVEGGSANPAPGPTAADVGAAEQQTPAERQQMIEGMVGGLAARLDASPDDAEGWARLFRAYVVLGRPADAEAALARARKALAGNSATLAIVEQAAADNGVAGATAPSAAPAPGPTAADVAAAQQQTPAERQKMIEGMVGGLAARLDASPDDAEGWARLFRAYIVLGRPADAESALAKARRALAGKSATLAAVEQAAADNGIGKAAP